MRATGAAPLERAAYVGILGHTAGEMRNGPHQASVPPHPGAALLAVNLDPGVFVAGVGNFARSLFGMVDEVHRFRLECERRGYWRRLGPVGARRLCRQVAAAD